MKIPSFEEIYKIIFDYEDNGYLDFIIVAAVTFMLWLIFR